MKAIYIQQVKQTPEVLSAYRPAGNKCLGVLSSVITALGILTIKFTSFSPALTVNSARAVFGGFSKSKQPSPPDYLHLLKYVHYVTFPKLAILKPVVPKWDLS